MENAIVRVPALGRRRGDQADQRAGGVHSRRRVHPRADRRARLLGRGRLLRARARRRRRDGAARRGVDRRGNAEPRRLGDGLAPLRRHYASREYTLARTVEVYSTYYDVKYPGHERQAGRPLRLSPTYARHAELGAAFGEKSGWERVNWFEPNAARATSRCARAAGPDGSGRRRSAPSTSPAATTAALFDETSFAKIEIAGEDAAEFLERLCANRVARDVGAITYTQMLNARGGIECDFTVTRLAEERFRIVTGTAFGRHDLAWIRLHAPDGVAGRGRHLEVRVPRALGAGRPRDPAAADDGGARRSRTCARASSRSAASRASRLRVTYVGELGWELYCPTEFGLALWDTIWEAGPSPRARRRRLQGDRLAAAREGLPRLGLRHHARGHAVRGGLGFAVKLDKGEFIGRDALLGAPRAGPPSLPASCSTTRARSRSAPSRFASTARSSAASRAAATATRSSARSRTPTCRGASRDAGHEVEVEIFGEWVGGSGRRGAALRSEGRAHPRVVPGQPSRRCMRPTSNVPATSSAAPRRSISAVPSSAMQ